MKLDLKKIKQQYRNKFIISMSQADQETPSKFFKYQIIDVLDQPLECNLIFILKDRKKLVKMTFSYEILQTGKGETRFNGNLNKCRIVNARNFPVIDSSYLSL